MSNQIIFIIMGIAGGFFVIIVLLYLLMRKKMQKSDYKRIRDLRKGTKASNFSMEVLYQKLYVKYLKIPFIKRAGGDGDVP